MKTQLNHHDTSIGLGCAAGIMAPTRRDLEIAIRSTAQYSLTNGKARTLKYKGVAQLPKDKALVDGFNKLPASSLYSVSFPADRDRLLTAGIVNGRIVVKETGFAGPTIPVAYYDAGQMPVF